LDYQGEGAEARTVPLALLRAGLLFVLGHVIFVAVVAMLAAAS
jgi:hypothetical protein